MSRADKLVHWVYRDSGGNVYNWGKVMSPLEWPIDGNYGLRAEGLDHVGCHVSLS
ncbi:hypothetical protein [Pseudoduganella sp. R-43]|uniref:hypothetical protein n=1 Tax=unclassified Pseudoduganella TaxID=2637179 RepID=UPI003CE72752